MATAADPVTPGRDNEPRTGKVPARRAPGATRRWPRVLWRVARLTFTICLRYRVTGLAAEAGFWALLSLPPLALGLVATLGYLHGVLGSARMLQLEHVILHTASDVLSPHTVNQVVAPIIASVLRSGRADVLSVSFVIALWSGSRALNVYVDTITIAYGMSGKRGIVRTRALSFSLYLMGLLLGSIGLPLMLLGPSLVAEAVPQLAPLAHIAYWPVIVLVSTAFLNTLYHVAVPERAPWVENLPGTLLALFIWLGGSAVLRLYLASTITARSPYGSMSAPVAVMLWLYMTALAVLIGACLNAAVNQVWPAPVISGLGAGPRRLLRRVPSQADADDDASDDDSTDDDDADDDDADGDDADGDDSGPDDVERDDSERGGSSRRESRDKKRVAPTNHKATMS